MTLFSTSTFLSSIILSNLSNTHPHLTIDSCEAFSRIFVHQSNMSSTRFCCDAFINTLGSVKPSTFEQTAAQLATWREVYRKLHEWGWQSALGNLASKSHTAKCLLTWSVTSIPTSANFAKMLLCWCLKPPPKMSFDFLTQTRVWRSMLNFDLNILSQIEHIKYLQYLSISSIRFTWSLYSFRFTTKRAVLLLLDINFVVASPLSVKERIFIDTFRASSTKVIHSLLTPWNFFISNSRHGIRFRAIA